MSDFDSLPGLNQAQIDWLLRNDVMVEAMIRPEPLRLARGRAVNRLFRHEPDGAAWLAIAEGRDVVYWQPRTREIATETGATFALGQDAIDLPETYAFDCYLNVFADPLEWLQAGREGVVVLDWSKAWERFHAAPRLALASPVIIAYRRHFKPPNGPEVVELKVTRRAAA